MKLKSPPFFGRHNPVLGSAKIPGDPVQNLCS